ncbi:hypothetical protein CY0110_19772 [Crocosphaera chwakensis CCY0110]|uniref:Uncharacterized protein n=1 Tax=Crocosphaera chwakensis CCY0110 TaxID=391612 RepID=A3IJT6_9CHRO|nr:hypothetical protein CY0110_19772 [Crocosphaera chwakensis CCY0110]
MLFLYLISSTFFLSDKILNYSF